MKISRSRIAFIALVLLSAAGGAEAQVKTGFP